MSCSKLNFNSDLIVENGQATSNGGQAQTADNDMSLISDNWIAIKPFVDDNKHQIVNLVSLGVNYDKVRRAPSLLFLVLIYAQITNLKCDY